MTNTCLYKIQMDQTHLDESVLCFISGDGFYISGLEQASVKSDLYQLT